jgi:hypothetical protein
MRKTVSSKALEAAHKGWREQAKLEGSNFEYNLEAALMVAYPVIEAELLRKLAKDTRARGDIGKEGGVEAWDYLNAHADLRDGEGEVG